MIKVIIELTFFFFFLRKTELSVDVRLDLGFSEFCDYITMTFNHHLPKCRRLDCPQVSGDSFIETYRKTRDCIIQNNTG